MDLNLIILSLLQGLTEFLPISSSGQMFLFEFFFNSKLNIQEKQFLFIFLHFGTTLAICLFFYKDIKWLISDFFAPGNAKKIYHQQKKVHKKKKNLYLILSFALLTCFSILGIYYLHYYKSFEMNSIIEIVLWIAIAGILAFLLKQYLSKKNNLLRPKKIRQKKTYLPLILILMIAFLPTLFIASFLKLNYSIITIKMSSLSTNFSISGFFLILSSLFYKKNPQKKKTWTDFCYKDAFLIGLIQGMCSLPGLSRSALTISIGIFLNLDILIAARFSFLLSVPTVISAILVEGVQNFHLLKNAYENLNFMNSFLNINYFIALLTSLFFGYLTLKFLFFWIKKFKSLYPFALICFFSAYLAWKYSIL